MTRSTRPFATYLGGVYDGGGVAPDNAESSKDRTGIIMARSDAGNNGIMGVGGCKERNDWGGKRERTVIT